MKIIFLAYRDWALKVYPYVSSHPKVHESVLCKTTQELQTIDLKNYDLLLTLGWSEELGEEVCTNIEAIGLHCAELDRYSYGSPLQLQIIDGIVNTKHRVFPFIWDKTSGRAHTHTREFSHEVDLSLHGSMRDIFEQLTYTSIPLFRSYLDDYPNIKWHKWPEEQVIRDKRVPLDSRLTKDQFYGMSTKELYNFFRCLEDPYPNGYLEDEDGILYIKSVMYKEKKND